METFNEINNQLFRFFNELAWQSDISDSVFVVFATSLAYVFYFSIITYLFLRKEEEQKTLFGFPSYFREPVMVLGVTLISLGFVLFLKTLFDIPRPFDVLPNVRSLVEQGLGDSFPSGHAMVLSSLSVAVMIYQRRLGILLLVLACLIGILRIIVGVHYPADILGGLLLGIFLPITARAFIHRLRSI